MAKLRKRLFRRVSYLFAALILAIVAMTILDRVAQQGERGVAEGGGKAGAAAGSGAVPSPASGVGSASETPSSQDQGADSASRADTASQASAPPSDSADDGDFTPIAIPLELADWFEHNEEAAAFHSKLEHEPEDPFWAQPVESFFEDHLNSTLDLSKYRVLSLECRSRSCEILALGYGDDALRGWMQSFSQLFQSEDELKAAVGGPGAGSCGGGAELGPGVVQLTCTFTRTDTPPDDSAPTETFRLDAPYPDGVTVDPVDVPESVASAIETSRELYDLHRRLESEQTDYSWSGYLEPEIRKYLEGLPNADSLEVLGIVCRSTLCEVQILARDESATIDFLPSMVDFQKLGWHDLATVGLNGTDSADGDPNGLVWILQRRQSD